MNWTLKSPSRSNRDTVNIPLILALSDSSPALTDPLPSLPLGAMDAASATAWRVVNEA
ncbi:hypothetical protein GBS0709_05270 [Edwardsiella tarda]|nr:hypothetical protein GBS0709_05270 [Edwardsiella tarda]